MMWAAELLVRAWAAQQRGLLCPHYHDCVASQCRVVQVRGYACAECRAIGSQPRCQACHARTKHVRFAYACERTGKLHACGEHCTLAARRNCCPLSHATLPPRTHQLCHVSAKPAPGACVADQCRGTVAALLFSEARRAHERAKFAQQLTQAKRAVTRAVKERRVRCTYALSLIVADAFKVRPYHAHLAMAPEQQEVVVRTCVRAITALWTRVHAHVPHNKLPAFTVACLFMMRFGLCVHDRRALPRYPLLRLALPDANAVNKILNGHVAHTVVRNLVLKALRQQAS